MLKHISDIFQRSIDTKQAILHNNALLQCIEQVTLAMVQAFKNDARVWLCGNGGSAADAQHIAAELSGRFYLNRPGLFAEALGVNFSYLTAVANDFGYDHVFERMIQAVGKPNDILIAFSTSGNSPNILLAVEAAKKNGLTIVGMTGETGGKMANLCNYLINIPSTDTPRIQEAHITVGHILCELVEKEIFS